MRSADRLAGYATTRHEQRRSPDGRVQDSAEGRLAGVLQVIVGLGNERVRGPDRGPERSCVHAGIPHRRLGESEGLAAAQPLQQPGRAGKGNFCWAGRDLHAARRKDDVHGDDGGQVSARRRNDGDV